MLKVASRVALEEMTGKRRIQVPSTEPKPDPSLEATAGLIEASRQMVEAAQLLAEAARHHSQPVKPKKLEAIVQRDSAGKMEKVIINVI